ncbi:hypothetical protein [Sinorhizobium mexicanum]|uniref:Uncharacterized protein n=1 Tax=Sinorhizobium mexicanum TaxID=375549 RepID=A0A859QX68_9HYPH|nr:hypothetical protein [Sinorhizobium mexicanum]MBP1887719.1 hypothetical protein [Sinorhizobium mexicanum]QLL63461.1 hypothetical protein FKV68_19440 [Sinorhizobium mexicanum]
MADFKKTDYLDPFPIPPYGGLGIGDEATNAVFDSAWPTVEKHLFGTQAFAHVLSDATVDALRNELRAVSNEYLAGKFRAETFVASGQKKAAKQIINHVDALVPQIEELWRVNLPTRSVPIAIDRRETLLELLKGLRCECAAVAGRRVQPGAMSAHYIRGAVLDFIASYESVLGLGFERSKSVGTGKDSEFIATGPRLLQIFFQAMDPKLPLRKLASVIQSLPKK